MIYFDGKDFIAGKGTCFLRFAELAEAAELAQCQDCNGDLLFHVGPDEDDQLEAIVQLVHEPGCPWQHLSPPPDERTVTVVSGHTRVPSSALAAEADPMDHDTDGSADRR